MPFCPDCLSEYRPGTVSCAACGTGLVDQVPAEHEPVEWVTIEETGDASAAAMVEGLLDDHGVPVRVLNRNDREGAAPADGMLSLEVQVPVDRLGQALDELENLDNTVSGDRAGPGVEPVGGP